MLLDAIATALRARLGNIRIDGVRSAKFSSPILPAQRVTLHIAADAATGRARFRCELDGHVATQGEIGFVAAAQPADC